MSGRAIIFGAGGQDGHFIREYLLSLGYQIFPFIYQGSKNSPAVDVADFNNVSRVIKEIKPNFVFHLAARSSTRHEFILENHRAIVDGTLTIMESVDRHAPDAKVFLASSGLIFRNLGRPLNENDEFITDTSYAMARLEALQIARYYRQRGREVFVGFLFNHESPLRPPNSVARKIAGNVAEIHLGIQNSLIIGNANVIKEWMWAGDAVKAMFCLVNQNDVSEACIGDGIGRSIREYATACCEVVNLFIDDYLVEISGYEAEYPFLVSDPSRIKSLGWIPEVDMASLAMRMVKEEILIRQSQKP
jgi:GDPmannose 4,6-dehydratase